MTKREFWQASGVRLLERSGEGWLGVTPDFLRAYLCRPELAPIDESTPAEVALHDALMADPALQVSEAELEGIGDDDVAESYRLMLDFRDILMASGTLEGAYLHLMRQSHMHLPPLFVDQMVHAILANVLADSTDAIRLRAAELFFREQKVSTEDGRIMLADEEIVEMHARARTETGIGQLLAATGTPMRTVALDVLTRDNQDIYWARSDRFDTVIDFRFEQPGPDAFARVVEAWLAHMLGIEARVEPMSRIDDDDWRWHVGLDRESTGILNALYEGGSPSRSAMDRILGLFRLRILDSRRVIERVEGHPIYLALAMTSDQRLKMKPQNLITNLPLRPDA
ncbi:MAG: hypothetical protein KDJ41_19225 [Hyphomicrobiaceae bacterium]|nr:hypothetical protein [Hyphomicrobiaceae bacterium]